MRKVKFFVLLCFLLSIFFNASAQFVDVQVEITTERMPEKERVDLATLEQMMPAYFENYEWIENSYRIQIPLRIKIFPQSSNTTGFERIFTAQFFISNEIGDQRFFERDFKFVYNTNDPLLHSDIPHSLTSLLDFYAMLMIAGEIDTYEPLGGNSAFEKARDIATRAQMSERPQGWKDRLETLEEILRVRDYRLFKYHYWSIIDFLNEEKIEEAQHAIAEALKYLERVFEYNARERYTHVFLDVHAREFIEILKDFATKEQIDKLISLDPDNEKLYKAILAEGE